MEKIAFLYLFILIGILSCSPAKQEQIAGVIEQVRAEYAPDSRTAIFDVKYKAGSPGSLIGETDNTEARQALTQKLASMGIDAADKVSILPDSSLHGNNFGLINVSVANLRSAPTHSAELVTQALLGMPVKVLKKNDGWLLIQTPDSYIAWTNPGSVFTMNETSFSAWKNDHKIIILTTWASALDSLGIHPVSDLVAGDVLVMTEELPDGWKVRFPDGRSGLVAKQDAALLNRWADNMNVTDSSLVATATRFSGIPYLWGGTSTKGMDCSGFTKTVYFLNGYILPRDASQQVFAGMLVDTAREFEKLQPGDLLFFGSKRADGTEKVVHVGMWIGDLQFIHASGDVHISSMDSLQENYDSYNYHRYLRTKRMLRTSESPGISIVTKFYQNESR